MQASAPAIPHIAVHETHQEEAGFWRTYVFSTDHKVIGIQYGITALCFLLLGFFLMMIMRWQIAHPGDAVPLVGPLLAAIFGEVVAVHISDAVITNGTVDITKLRPIARLGGMDYAVVDSVFTMQRPR